MEKGQDISDNSTASIHMYTLTHSDMSSENHLFNEQPGPSHSPQRYLLMQQLCLIFGLGARNPQLLSLGCKSASLWAQNGENGARIT